MEKLLKDFEVDPKNPSNDELRRWRSAVGIVKNSRRRFRTVADLDERAKAEKKKQAIQEKIRVALYVQKAALQFIDAGLKRMLPLRREYIEAGFGIDVDDIGSIVTQRDRGYLRQQGGVEGIAEKVASSLVEGVNKNDIPTRQKIYGLNHYKQKPPRTFWLFVWDTLHDLSLQILTICALVSIGLGIAAEGWPEGLYDGLGIIIVISLEVMITSISDYKQYLQFRGLNREKENSSVHVTRAGRRQEVSTYDLVVGDVVILSIGDQVPADGIFISGYSLQVDKSSLTGETEPSYVDQAEPFLLAGSKVLDGSGKMLVTNVGSRTEWGKLMEAMSDVNRENETPLQVKLNGVATIFTKFDLALDLLTLVALIVNFLVRKAVHKQFTHWSSRDALKLMNFFIVAVTIIVAAVPEELPIAVIFGLTFAMKKLLKERVLVKRLSACETMGSVSCICTDKTGTLTTKDMAVAKIWICRKANDAICDVNKGVLESEVSKTFLIILLQAIFLNTSSEVVKGKDGKFSIMGTPIESALLQFGLLLDDDFDVQCREFRTVKVEPFSPSRKKMSVLVACPDSRLRAFCKGATEIVLRMCDKVVDHSGESIPLFEEQLKTITNVIDGFASEAIRTLCLAFKDLDDISSEDSIPNDGYTLIAVVGVRNPVRPGVKEAIQSCSEAGITVRMVTGDCIHTARAIAKECGILSEDGVVIKGSEFCSKSLDEKREILPKIQVIARSFPSDKGNLVTNLRNMFGEVVAVTGDGINDALALRESDIGIAMGIAGTEAAKEIADAIILDDDFSNIVKLVKWGRAVYANSQKFVQFQLTYNIVVLLINFLSACFSGSPALTPVQMLWMKIIMDNLGGLALATLPPNKGLMKKPPVAKGASFITKPVWRNIIGQSIYQLLVLALLIFDGKQLLGLNGRNAKKVLNTLIFNSFVFCQVFNELNSLDTEKINIFRRMFDSWIFIAVIISIVICQVLIVEFLGTFTGTVPLSWQQWLISILIAVGGMLFAALLKCIPVEKDASKLKHPDDQEEQDSGLKIA